MTAADAVLRRRIMRVHAMLVSALGEPKQPARLPPPLDMLVATILSQNTNDKNSHRAFLSLKRQFPGWKGMASAPLHRLKKAIKTGGMANQKAPRIRNVLARIHEQYGTYDLSALRKKSNEEIMAGLTALEGVGVKTASCVLLFSLGRDVFPVDTHVHRVCGRLGLAPGARTPEDTFRIMQGLVPRGKSYSLHTNLIRFGRRTCRSSNPLCGVCPFFAECSFPGKKAARKQVRPSTANHDFMLLDNVGT